MAVKKAKKTPQEEFNKYSSSNDNLSSTISQVESGKYQMRAGYYDRNFNDLARKLLSTVKYDKRMYSVAIESLKAQLKMEIKRRIVGEEDGRLIIEALNKVKKKIYEGSLVIDDSFKNIYDALEKFLEHEIGKTAYKLRIARSHNEQVAGDTKLWLRDACDALDNALQNTQAALLDKAEDNVKTIMPSYTSGQTAQPITLGYYLISFVEMFGRDRQRLKEMRKRLNSSPFGSGEYAGTLFNVNREMVARILGFDSSTNNAIDAITDKDHIIEFMSISSICATHLSKLAEDLLQWNSSPLHCISFSDTFISKSPLFVQRREPEILELIRAKSGKTYGDLINSLTILKGLSNNMSYDIHLAHESVFETYDTLLSCMNMMSALVADFIVSRKRFKDLAQKEYSVASDLFDWILANTSLGYEETIDKTQEILEYAEQRGKKLSLLSVEEFQKIIPEVDDNIYSTLIPSRAIVTRRSKGGSNPVQVRKAIRASRREYL